MENNNYENEIWLPIADFPNYQISNYGRVKSLIPYRGTNERILKPEKIKGYLSVDLGKNNPKLIHRLVAQAFLLHDDSYKTEINHKDENKENNHVENLEWCTREYNNNYGTHQKRSATTRINHPKFSKQVNQYSLDGTLIKTWQSTHEIERQLGFTHQNISKCCNGYYKTANGFIWRFA